MAKDMIITFDTDIPRKVVTAKFQGGEFRVINSFTYSHGKWKAYQNENCYWVKQPRVTNESLDDFVSKVKAVAKITQAELDLLNDEDLQDGD